MATLASSPAVRICVLDADHIYPELVPRYQGYGAMFERLLGDAAAALGIGLQICVFDVRGEQYPPTDESYDGFLITGSKADAFADDPWIIKLRDYAAGLVTAKITTAGVCFGHQLLALVIGGEVGRAPQGWGVGLMAYQCAAPSVWPRPLQQAVASLLFAEPEPEPASVTPVPLQLLASHRDQVKRLPANANLLAGNPFCPIAAFSVDDHLLCFQGHPEFSGEYLLALMTLRREVVGEANYQCAEAAQAAAHQGQLVGQWLVQFLAAKRVKTKPNTLSDKKDLNFAG